MNLGKIKSLKNVKSVAQKENEITIDTTDYTYTKDNFGETLIMKTNNKENLDLIKKYIKEEEKDTTFNNDYEWEDNGNTYFLYNDNVFIKLDNEFLMLDKNNLPINSQIKVIRFYNKDLNKAFDYLKDLKKQTDLIMLEQDKLLSL